MSKDSTCVEFMDDCGSFRLRNPGNINELYFPLCNEAGFMASITPMLHGDSKTDLHHFLLAPVTVEDLHNTKSARNFWLYIEGDGPWSIAGNSSKQKSMEFNEGNRSERIIEAGPLWHKLTYIDSDKHLVCETTNFVPADGDLSELMRVSILNTGSDEIRFTPTSAIPIYGRSAENIRDHRHVTSLINRAEILEYGILVKPLIIFNEHGHKINDTFYYAIGFEEDGTAPAGMIPSAHDFIGEKGSFEWPEAIVRKSSPDSFKDHIIDGTEYVGALQFRDYILKPGEKKDYFIITGIANDKHVIEKMIKKYGTGSKVNKALDDNKSHWSRLADKVTFHSGLKDFSLWMKWVGLQPVFRKIYGCSFLPYHDYGKGGRGWRDLWQDCLSLILQDPSNVRPLLFNNFAGIRIDGTNATIIGSRPGEFLADRNNIARVWMDHGTWPYLTTRLYIDQSGDFELLMEKQSYFRDALVLRAALRDQSWSSDQGVKLKTHDGSLYAGTLIEHLLIQHLTSFFNVGEHNIIRLEGADWNDTLDMAREKGESTAFTALFGSNLIGLADLIQEAGKRLRFDSVEIFEELSQLLDTISGSFDYESIEYKHRTLRNYLELAAKDISGKRKVISIEDLTADLRKKGDWIFSHIRNNEFLSTRDGSKFFNGYYNNDGKMVDGDYTDGIRMNLTAQVFTTMFGLASEEQVLDVCLSTRKYLKDPLTGGYRLNTPLGPNKLNFGRGFAFAYGEKENGATFCHMAVMYMNALYKRNFVHEAYDVFKSLYNLSENTSVSGIYPGIPEYFNSTGKGLYHYLTGSASWLLLTVLTEMFGIRGENGDLVIHPKLTHEQFDEFGEATVKTTFRGKELFVRYSNPGGLDYGMYKVEKIIVNGQVQEQHVPGEYKVKFAASEFEKWRQKLDITVVLGLK